MVAKFIFGGDTQETPETLKRKREVLDAMKAQRRGTPQNVGEGLQAIGDALAYRMGDASLRKKEAYATQQGNDIMSQIVGALSGGGMGGMGGGSTPSVPGAGGGNGNTSAMDFSGGSGGSGGYRDAIASIESGGRYDAIGPTNSKMGRALGKYQIMEANVGPWSQAALGRAVTPDEFLKNPQIQDAVFDHQFGNYVNKYGPEGAAQAWLGGPGSIGKTGRKDVLGTSVGEYGHRFMKNLGQGGGMNASAGPLGPYYGKHPPVQTASLDPSSGMEQALQQQPQSPGPSPPVMAALMQGANRGQQGFQIVPPNNEGLATPGGQSFLQTMTNPQSMMGGGAGPMQMGSPMQGSPRAQPQMDMPQGPGAPGEIRQGPGGQNLQNVETTGMLGATGSQGWIPTSQGQGNPPQQQAPVQVAQNGGGMDMAQLLKLAQNPYAPPEAKQMIFNLLQSQWEQRQKQNDPKTQMDLQKEQLEIDRMRNPTTDDITEYKTYVEQAKAAGEQPKSFYEYQTTVKRAGANNMTVNQPFESQYQKDYGAGRAKLKLGIEDAASNAYDSNNQLDIMEQSISDPNFYSGAAGEPLARLKTALVSAGIMDKDAAASVETFQAIANKLVLSQMGGSLGTGFSNADRDFVKGQVPSLDNSPEGNTKLIGLMRKLNERKIQIAEMADDYASQHGGQLDAGWNSELRKFARSNPLFPKSEQAPGSAKPVIKKDGYTIVPAD